MTNTTKNPTRDTYDFLSSLYTLINQSCFDNALPFPLITLKGKGQTVGYYKYNEFVSADKKDADELAVNPAFFASHGFKELVQTFGHEMCHQWQQHFGEKLSRRAYHNKEWGDKMRAIGLIPSNTGQPGGKTSGQQMAEYMDESGPIVDLFHRLAEEGRYIPWYERLASTEIESLQQEGVSLPVAVVQTADRPTRPYQTGTTRVRYLHRCEEAGKATIYGKPNLSVLCGYCGQPWEQANKR